MDDPGIDEQRTRTRNRNTELGDRACFCVSCGWARRFYPGVVEPPDACPSCEGGIVSACPTCGIDIVSVMAVECDECGSPLRATEANGVRIHRPKRRPAAKANPSVDAPGGLGSRQS